MMLYRYVVVCDSSSRTLADIANNKEYLPEKREESFVVPIN